MFLCVFYDANNILSPFWKIVCLSFGYLNIFLASDYGFPLITRHTYGSVVDEIDDHHVRAIPVPLLKNHEVQKQINDLALEANQKRYEAYLLEQEALQIMDTEVIYAK